MTQFSRNLTTAIIALFIVVMMVLVAGATLREEDPLEGNLTTTLQHAPRNLEVMPLIPSDVYGADYSAIGFICSGMAEDKVKEAAPNPDDITFEDGVVPEGKSYVMALGHNVDPYVEELDSSEVEVCEMINAQVKTMEQQGHSLDGGVPLLQGSQPLTFQSEDGVWKLVG